MANPDRKTIIVRMDADIHAAITAAHKRAGMTQQDYGLAALLAYQPPSLTAAAAVVPPRADLPPPDLDDMAKLEWWHGYLLSTGARPIDIERIGQAVERWQKVLVARSELVQAEAVLRYAEGVQQAVLDVLSAPALATAYGWTEADVLTIQDRMYAACDAAWHAAGLDTEADDAVA